MKLGYKNGWNSLMPHRVGKKSFRFCLLSKVCSTGKASGNAPVYLNVYDLTPLNGYVYWAGLGIFHSGVEVHGVEYAFGAHDYATSGVFEVEPRQCPGFRFRKSIFIGTTSLNPIQVREFMGHHSVNYNGDTYHLIAKNCNHFCKDVCYKLTGNSIPKWVNRLARIGSFCNRLLPETIKISAIRHGLDCAYEEKSSLRGSFDCLSFMSVRHGPLFSSSPFFSLPLKGCLPPLESRKSGLIPVKGADGKNSCHQVDHLN